MQNEGVKELSLTERRIALLEQEIVARNKELVQVREDLKREQTVHRDERRLLDIRTQELQDAHTYLTINDTLSGNELVAKVESLNAEIYQVSAYMADSMSFRERVDPDSTPVEVVRWLGSYIVHLLCSPINDETRIQVVQIVTQASLVQCCADFISMWHIERHTDMNLSRLYAQILKSSRAGGEQ